MTQKSTVQYDYIIAGAGASGCSLAWAMLQSPLSDKKVLLVDSKLKPTHDKTWCFWSDEPPPYADIIYKKWTKAKVSAFGKMKEQRLTDYTYYCIRSVDFQKKVFSALKNHPNFDLLESSITKIVGSAEGASLYTDDAKFNADYIFQSCFEPPKLKAENIRYPLLQHFEGWELVLQKPHFDASSFTLMDFDHTFDEGVAFIYLLPWSAKRALIEYTVFSRNLMDKKSYEKKIDLYLYNKFSLRSVDYNIERKEFGQIPMQDRPHIPWYAPHVLNIGTRGGVTKPSTGYTFSRIQKQCKEIVRQLVQGSKLQPDPPSKFRYKAFDLWLLQIIDEHPREALQIFSYLFKNNTMDSIFRFLDEENNIREDLKIMNSVPYAPFLNAIWKTKGRLFEL